jgi:outer membrane lipoprotein-sorting protein
MTKKFKNKKIYENYYPKQKNNKRKIIIAILISILIIIVAIFFIKINNKTAKISKIGNNSTSQEIVDYVLNINSYETEIEVEIKSNKNTNKYKIKQTYISSENNTQEVIEPSNIQGVRIIKEGNNLKIENTKLSLTKIIENYQDITQNNLDLASFIENYKNNENSKYKEENDQIIMETTAKTGNNYQKYETLYVSKENGKPIKMEIKDTNQNIIIYIIYNEIKIQS